MSNVRRMPQPFDVELGVEPRVSCRALRADEALLLVDPQGLGMHADELRGDRDHVAGTVVHQLNNLSRGFAFDAFLNPSSASRSALFSFSGTLMRRRASISP